MKTQIIRHGEVILKPESLPEGAQLLETTKKHIVAHSETGHHHVLESTLKDIKIYTFNSDKYIEIPTVAELWHQKTGKDVHTPHKVAPSVYRIVIKKEFNYFSGLLQRVRD